LVGSFVPNRSIILDNTQTKDISMIKVKRALISVSDKKGLIPFAKGLAAQGVEIISTGGTARQLQKAGLAVREVSDYTGFPEMLEGRVKTLHPMIHGGLLALRDKEDHMDQVKQHGIGLIDLVVVNLYPFESVIQKKNVAFEEAIENIDIGGPSMLRSAAKNFKSVAVICNPDRYSDILEELDTNNGLLSDTVLFNLAVEAFEHTARYDAIVSGFLRRSLKGEGESFVRVPEAGSLKYTKLQDLRYGENPHQQAAFYQTGEERTGLAASKQLHGKELSFNNFLDLNAAIEGVKGFSQPAVCIIKHNNPTGVAEDKDLAKAYKSAWQCDTLSAFGGIIGLNRKMDAPTATLIVNSGFMECVVAPMFAKDALAVLKQKKNLRILKFDFKRSPENAFDLKQVYGGILLQEKDTRQITKKELRVVTKKKPTEKQLEAALFGWRVIRQVKSNAIILVQGSKTVGIGCGQTSRVESVKIAIRKAGKKAKGAVLVSDAFIPKTDNIALAAEAGVKMIIQTGGSIADDDVIAACDQAGIAMVMTGIRHFKH
jgi:phosphoribosylaminoimidazolecarboxamide formyltransferase/IMP cyclohydrolase